MKLLEILKTLTKLVTSAVLRKRDKLPIVK